MLRQQRYQALEHEVSGRESIRISNPDKTDQISGEESALRGFWRRTCTYKEQSELENLRTTLEFLGKTMETCLISPLGSLLHKMYWMKSDSCPDDQIDLIRTWMRFLRSEDYDFDQPNEVGSSPLLDHLWGSGNLSLEIVCLLVEFGVDVHVLDANGCNSV